MHSDTVLKGKLTFWAGNIFAFELKDEKIDNTRLYAKNEAAA